MRNSVMITLVAAAFFFGIGCGKPKSGEAPELILEKVNTHEVPRQGLLRFTFKFRSSEPGDSIRMIFSRETLPDCETVDFDEPLTVPVYPNTVGEGILELNFTNGLVAGYTEIPSPQCGDNEERIFKFVFIDIKGNRSDTVVSDPIVFLK